MKPQWRTSSHSATNGECVEAASWRKSTASSNGGGNCVEAASWRRSTRCPNAACVEVGYGVAVIGVRDSQDPDGGRLEFSPAAWRAFAARLTAFPPV
jgi:hypothetical protein